MRFPFRLLIGIVACSVLTGVALGQAIQVRQKPAPAVGPNDQVVYDQWTVSAALRDDAQPTMDWGTYPTKDAAYAAAQNGLARNHAASKPSDWTYAKFVVVEGEPSIRSKDGPTAPSADRNQDDTLKSLKKDTKDKLNDILKKDVQNAFKKKNQELRDIYERVKKFKEYAVRNVGKISDDEFKKVNGLVAEYNGKADQYKGDPSPYGEYFSALPRLTPVSANGTKRQSDEWKKAGDEQQDLDKEKQELDAERAKLEKERQELIDEGVALDGEAASTGDDTGITGSEWEIPQSGNIFGLRILNFTSDTTVVGQYNVEASRREGTWQAGGPGQIELTLNGGTRTATINGNQMQVGRVTLYQRKAGTPDPQAQAKRAEVARKQQDRAGKVGQYKAELAQYNQRLADFQKKLAAFRANLGGIKADTYVPPAIQR